MDRMKQKKAEYLLGELGGIDDRFLCEAMEWKASGKSTASRRPIRVLLIAATLAMALVISLVGTVAMLLRRGEAPSPNDPPVLDEVQSFNRLLFACTESESFTQNTIEEIDFFDGAVRLTVQDRATGALYVSRPLTSGEQASLSRDLSAQKQRATAEASAEYLVWITLGNGDVLSPYLAHSAGNVGAATLFDYEAEYVPTQEFNDLLGALLS